MIEVRYAGAVVGRTAIVRELDTRGLFLGITEPLPVGTPVTLKIGDDSVEGKVSAVAESPELARTGMRVRFSDPSAAGLFGTPGEAAPEPEPVLPTRPAVESAAVDQAAPAGLSAPAVSGPRRIVVDASTEHAVPDPSSGSDGTAGIDAADATGAVASPDGRSGDGKPGDGKKSRRNKRR